MQFKDVVGHQRQIDFLRRADAGNHLAHALLFAGPPGIGKRLTADALAALAVCERDAGDACTECPGCRLLAAGAHPDVMIVEVPRGKREIPIDSVRQLSQFLRLQPLRAPRKVAIIDDAHLLNLPAQNALLKGLEEPPEGSIMILIAPNADALLPTVRSRCQRLLFGPLPNDLLSDVLTGRLGIPAEESKALIDLADGSPGRALRVRALLPARTRDALLNRLARLGGTRYGALVQLASEVSGSEELAQVALESLLRSYCHNANESARSGGRAPLAAIARRAGLVTDALATLRRRNVNRQLLLESLFVQLACL